LAGAILGSLPSGGDLTSLLQPPRLVIVIGGTLRQ
jgi:flagellar motor component MotA